MSKNYGICCILALIAISGCKDRKLTDDLEWMDNTYNAHEGVSMSLGHGRTGWYLRLPDGGEKLSSGTIDKFKNDRCNFEFHIEDDPSDDVHKHMLNSTTLKFNLRDIDPETVKVKAFSHYGGFNCEGYTPEQLEASHIECDYTEMTAFTRNEKALVQEESHTVYTGLVGEEHESSTKSVGKEIYFGISDPVYARKFADVFQDAIRRCGGTKGAAS